MGQAGGFGLGEGLPRLRRGLRVTHLGDERLVLDPASGVVHTVRGEAVRVLDRALLTGSLEEIDSEPVGALVSAGILEASPLTRRRILEVAAGAGLLVTSVALPSAVAAASGLSASVSGEEGVLAQFDLPDGSLLYSLTHSAFDTAAVTRTLVIGASARNVELVLVGGGGAGGDGVVNETIYAGGGGGGEVRYVNLGLVDPTSQFTLEVGGGGFRSSGDASTVIDLSASPTVSYVADGGGVGAGSASKAAGNGGSGGGGSSASTTRGSTTTGDDVNRYGSDGAQGNTGFSGGGGGAGVTAPTTATGTVGGSGGSAKQLSDFFPTRNLSGVTGQLFLGAGGGGAGTGSTEDDRGPSGLGGGVGGFLSRNGQGVVSGANGGENAVNASGGGGGGGVSLGFNDASGGYGGTGVIWVLVS